MLKATNARPPQLKLPVDVEARADALAGYLSVCVEDLPADLMAAAGIKQRRGDRSRSRSRSRSRRSRSRSRGRGDDTGDDADSLGLTHDLLSECNAFVSEEAALDEARYPTRAGAAALAEQGMERFRASADRQSTRAHARGLLRGISAE